MKTELDALRDEVLALNETVSSSGKLLALIDRCLCELDRLQQAEQRASAPGFTEQVWLVAVDSKREVDNVGTMLRDLPLRANWLVGFVGPGHDEGRAPEYAVVVYHASQAFKTSTPIPLGHSIALRNQPERAIVPRPRPLRRNGKARRRR